MCSQTLVFVAIQNCTWKPEKKMQRMWRFWLDVLRNDNRAIFAAAAYAQRAADYLQSKQASPRGDALLSAT
jgi:antirestriction protein ArdC